MARRFAQRLQTTDAGKLALSSSVDDLEVIRTFDAADLSVARVSLPIVAPSNPRRRATLRRLRLGMSAGDALCVALALLATHASRGGLGRLGLGDALLIALAVPALTMGTFAAFGLYAPLHLSPGDEARRVVGASASVVVIVAAWPVPPGVPRGWPATLLLLVLAGELAARTAWRSYRVRSDADRRLSMRTLIVGTTREAGRLCDLLRAPRSGFAPLGYVYGPGPTASPDSLPVLGPIEALGDLVTTHGADCLFIATPGLAEDTIGDVLTLARRRGLEVRIFVNVPETLPSRAAIQALGSDMMIAVRPATLRPGQARLKRAFDVVAATLLLAVTLPLWLLIAAAIRLTSPGPALFKQQRVALGMRIFTMYKFRTMAIDGDRLIDESGSVDLKSPFFKLTDDPRLTKVGRLIRTVSLDELPQLLNVIRGDMSMVGPRPLPVEQVVGNPELLTHRHELPAGLTGWWQINGRSDLTPEESIRLDRFYIENWSLSLDLYILVKTITAVVDRRGAI